MKHGILYEDSGKNALVDELNLYKEEKSDN